MTTLAEIKPGDFFRCFDGPNRYQFGKCTCNDGEWFRVEFFKDWDYRRPGVTYPLSISRHLAEHFLLFTEIWP